MSTGLSADLQDRYDPDDGRDPYRQPAVLRCAFQKHVLSLRDAAEAISEAFDIDVSKSTVGRAKKEYDIRHAEKDGVFADVLEGVDGTEPGQPPSFYIQREDSTPVHPYDTDCFEPVPLEGGGAWDDTLSTTPHFRPSHDSQSTDSSTHTSNPNSDRGTGVYKGPTDVTPSDYRVTKQHRDESLVAPPSAPYSEDFPAKYVACGCGNCAERHFLDGDGGTIDCPAPVPVTLAGARRIYRTAEGANVAADDRDGDDVQRGTQKYSKTTKADSAAFRANGPNPTNGDGYTANGPICTDHITTVLVSLRPSPTDVREKLVTPYTLVQDTKDSWAEARDEIPRNVGEGLLSYVWSLAGTDDWATPHVHCYLYYYDRFDAVERSDFTRMVTRYLNAAAFGSVESHIEIKDDRDDGKPHDCGDSRGGGDFDGETTKQSAANDTAAVESQPVEYAPDDVELTDGVVRVEPDPLLANPERLSAKTSGTGVFDDILRDETGADRLTDGDVQSRGAIYLAKQFPQLALKGAEPDAAVETAAFIDVASDNRHTFGGSQNHTKLADAMDTLREFEAESIP